MTDTLMPPDQNARDTACDPARSVLVQAPAGSGKTGVLLLRYLRCLLTVQEPEQVVAITFTRKAAAEIRERVLHTLRQTQRGVAADNPYEAATREAATAVLQHDRERCWALLENPLRLRISTFDSFCGSLARRLPLLSGLGSIQTSDDARGLYREAILSLFQSLEEEGTDPDLRRALGNVLEYANNRLEQLLPLLSNLLGKRDQWVAGVVGHDVQAMERALGEHVAEKLQAICQQLQALGCQPALTALVELSGHSEALAWAAELPALEAASIDKQAELAQAAEWLTTKNNTLIAPRTAGPTKGFIKGHPGTDAIKDWLEALRDSDTGAQVAALLGALKQLPSATLPDSARDLCGDFTHILTHLLVHLRLVFESEGQMDFGEVALRAITALTPPDESAGDYGDALLREDRIQHILVDEMQDTSASQIELLRQLCQGWQPDDGRSLFLCGDLLQSIYLFRGALVSLFAELIESGRFADRPLQLLQLQANFRSAPMLVKWVNGAFAELFSDGHASYTPALPQRDNDGAVNVHGFVIPQEADKADAARAEAHCALDIIRRVRSEQAQASVAVLVRSRSVLSALIPLLKEADIPFAGQDIDLLNETPAVVDFVALLRAWWHDADRAAWVGVLRAPFVGLGWDDIWLLCQQPGQQPELLRDIVLSKEAATALPLSEEGRARLARLRSIWQAVASHQRAVDIRWALPALWHSLGGPASIQPHQQVDIDRVLSILAEHADGGYLRDISAFELSLSQLYAQPAPAGVQLMTIHKAKGLEFDVVIVPGLGKTANHGDADLIYWKRLQRALVLAPRPPAQLDDADTQRLYDYFRGLNKDEQRLEVDRLLYVALTRARSELHLIGSVTEDRHGEVKPRGDSLLARLWPVLEQHFEDAPRVQAGDALQPVRVPLAPRLDCDVRLQMAPCHPSPLRSEDTLDRLAEQEKQAVLEDNIEDRAVGIVYHELMRRLGSGRRELLDNRDALGAAIRSRLRHHCHPEEALEDSLQRVLRLADNTLACKQGQWILNSYQISGEEQAIRQKLGDSWQRMILDRFFVDGETCWIIDYKTADARGDLDGFLAGQRERYGEKMQRYREAVMATGMVAEVKAALYFPASQRLEVIE